VSVVARRRRRPTRAAVAVWVRRLDLVADALGKPRPAGSASLEARLAEAIDVTDRTQVWLTLAVLAATLPDDLTVERTAREALFHGPRRVLDAVADLSTKESLEAAVRVVTEATLVDVQHTASTPFATGIQRVARETVRRWAAAHPVVLVSWTEGFSALRTLTPEEEERMTGQSAGPYDPSVLVPWRATYVVPELAADLERTRRLLALARHSDNRTGTIGFDTVPITSAETSDTGFAGYFANYLAAVRHFDRIATISRAAATEYRGWRAMLAAIGLPGPDIEPVLLPAEAPSPDDGALASARRRFVRDDLPLVLCVGTFEPRKNHLAVLHAAEMLWRDGLRFSLTFVGGRSWKAGRFQLELSRLQEAGYPVETASGVPDAELWAAYRLARFTVFPSLNEGFGLPAAESLAAGTPVVTSNFGSMAEIASDGGAVLVDPRDDESLIDGMRRLLVDDRLLMVLRAEAAARSRRTWDDYATDTWKYLVGTSV